MTILVGCMSVLLALSVSIVGVQTARSSATRARAQGAADAAALAAIAESGPYGGNDPEIAATEYARLNGARMIACTCPTGATAMQVEVAIGETRARARAVFEPELLRPAADAFAATGLDPRLRASIEQLVARSNGRIYVVSGYRSIAEQQVLWTRALQQHGSAEAADDWVAPPGHSMHQRGLAADLGGDPALAAALAERLSLPLWRPMSYEPGHFELVGSRS